jgi:D-cysteine desulfhydrase
VEALDARWPALRRAVPRLDLQVRETPLQRWTIDGVSLLVKRDDLSTPTLGGNKARALSLLLAGAGPEDTLLTMGATGSTHALAVAHFGARLGARTRVVTWPQEEHDVARATAARLRRLARVTAARSPMTAAVHASLLRLRTRARWIPAGGSTPLGALGHVGAAMELADQLARAGEPAPDLLVVPLGSGGTVAGLLVGLELAGLPTRVIAVRVVPRIVANRRRVLRLARRTAALFARAAAAPAPALRDDRLEIDGAEYGGAYGRATTRGRAAIEAVRETGGPALDATYSAKAMAAALERARRAPRERVLFWLTFDGRWLDEREDATPTDRGDPSSRVGAAMTEP